MLGAQHQRLAPVAHGALGVGVLRGAEGARRLGVIEGESKANALVEIRLGALAGGGDRYVQLAEIVVQGRRGGLARLGGDFVAGFGRGLLARCEGAGFRLGLGLHQVSQQWWRARPRRRAGGARNACEQRIETGIGRAAPRPERWHGGKRHGADDGNGNDEQCGNGGNATRNKTAYH